LKIRVNAIQTLTAAVLLGFLGLVQQSAALIATTTVVVSSPNPSASGQTVMFTATVTPQSGTGTPAGTVSFQLGSKLLCNFPISGGVKATCSVSTLPVGTDAIKATYLGDSNFLPSSGTVHQKVKSSTATAVTTAASPSIFGQSVKFTATVTSNAGVPADGEKVTFKNGTAALGTGTMLGGVATFTTSTLAVGAHTINAFYAGDTKFVASSGSTSQTVQKATTNLSISAPQGVAGQPVKITANVTSSTGAFPTGSVTFKNGTLTLGHATLSGGNASITPTFSTNGSYTIQGTYAGGTDLVGSSGSGMVNVGSSSIVVTITNKIGNVQAGASAITLNANVQNDSHSAGVTWTLMASNANCSPACGTLSNNTSTSVSYTPPATEPTGANTNPTITAASATDTTKSDTDSVSITSVEPCGTGNEAIMNGQYAFLLRGFKQSGVSESVGSFTTDGTGKITAAEIDLNDLNHGPRQPAIVASTSSYSVGSDNRGCLTFNTADGPATFRFVLGGISAGVSTKGRMIQFTDTTGTGTRATGTLLKQDPAAFSAGLSGNYAFGLSGQDVNGGRFASIGAVAASAGTFSNGEQEVDDASTASFVSGASGSYSTTLDSNGRGTGNLSSGHFAFYVVSSSRAFSISTDVLAANAPIDAGEVRLQTGPFTDGSMHGLMVMELDGQEGSSFIADIGILNADGSGGLSGTDYRDDGGTSTAKALSGTYSVSTTGRVTIAAPGPGGFAYLTGPNAGFIVATNDPDELGEFEPQAAGPFSNASLSGTFFFGTCAVDNQGSSVQTGTVTPDGAGNYSGTGDNSGSDGLSTQTVTGTYLANADGSGNVGSGTVMLVISNNKFVFIDEGNTGTGATPKVAVVEK